jgi:hypothetical protein
MDLGYAAEGWRSAAHGETAFRRAAGPEITS